MELKDGKQAVQAKTRREWRRWLEKNHSTEKSVLLILFHKKSQVQSVDINEAMEEALCFGWIDSKAMKRDSESFYLTFSPRNPKSNWSRINKERAEKLIQQGLMTGRGQKMIDLARQTGTWDALTDVENLVIPSDLQKLFDKNEIAFNNFNAFSPSSKRIILEWIRRPKKPETRQKRIEETVSLAAKNIKANHVIP
jgi:uncharacterized protein YdeI (YjbR/CyaY-like superfamily)